LTGIAVKVTLPPTHIDVVVELIVTDGMTLVAVIDIALLVAVVGVAQGSLLVITVVTTSLFTRVVVVNVAAV
jgi:ribonuclease PH